MDWEWARKGSGLEEGTKRSMNLAEKRIGAGLVVLLAATGSETDVDTEPELPSLPPGAAWEQELQAPAEPCRPLLGLHRVDPISRLPASWRVREVRGADLPSFQVASDGSGPILRIESQDDAAFAYRTLSPPISARGSMLRWRWRTETPIRHADLRAKSEDDSPLRLFLLLSAEPVAEGRLLRDGRVLFYSWGNREPVGDRFASHVSDRLAVFVLRNAADADGVWREEVRDPFEDYHAFFGEEAPPIRAIGVIPDTDQTGARVVSELTEPCWGVVSAGTESEVTRP